MKLYNWGKIAKAILIDLLKQLTTGSNEQRITQKNIGIYFDNVLTK